MYVNIVNTGRILKIHILLANYDLTAKTFQYGNKPGKFLLFLKNGKLFMFFPPTVEKVSLQCVKLPVTDVNCANMRDRRQGKAAITGISF